jgi:acetyl esterase/lipase
MAEDASRTIYQPIHPSIRSRLDHEYVAFHERYLQYVPSSESIPWDLASRLTSTPSAAGRSEPVEVGSQRDFDYGGHEQIRIFTPKGERPESRWPVLVWLHGGGWTMGGLTSENSFLTRCCSEAKCCVVSVNYIHAPEDPYPAAIDDAVDAYWWIVSQERRRELGIDVKKVAVGGLSAHVHP